MDQHLHACPAVDKFMAVFGNGASLTAWILQPNILTAIGGAIVSLATASYFIMRALHEAQRMKHERELHQRDLEAYTPSTLECPECGASNPSGAESCEECGVKLTS